MDDQRDADELPARDAPRLLGLVGVYHASGTLWGELSYWVKARFGGGHCALCDITHGTFREKQGWKDCRASLPVAIETVHLDERDDDVARFTEGRTPCVVGRTTHGLRMLVDPDQLEACDGSPQRLARTIAANATALGLS